MKKLVGLFLCSILFFSYEGFSGDITTADVNRLIAGIERIAESRDADTLAQYLADDISITMNISVQGQSRVLSPTKAEYIAMLKQGWAQFEDYSYEKSNVVIDIQGSTATVSATVKETMSMQGQQISGESQEQVVLKRVKGKLLVTEIVAHTSM